MDDNDFVVQYVTNIDPSPDGPEPRGCAGWLYAIAVLLFFALLAIVL